MDRVLFGIPVAAVVVSMIAGIELTPRTKDAEVLRLQQHFQTVEKELLARDISGLSAAQRAARSRHIEVLREYARAAVFPHNHDFAVATPYFMDAHGTLCAMAYLIARSGRGDLVEKVVRTANNAYLTELARDPELRAWLDSNGLTVAEAARIQPTYGPTPEAKKDASYEIATVAASAISGGAITWTLLSDPRRSSYAPGLVTSVIGLGDLLIAAGGALGDIDGGMSESEDQLTTLNVVVGAATLLAGLTHIVRVASARADRPAPTSRTSSSQLQKWQPLVYNDVSGRTRLGVNFRF